MKPTISFVLLVTFVATLSSVCQGDAQIGLGGILRSIFRRQPSRVQQKPNVIPDPISSRADRHRRPSLSAGSIRRQQYVQRGPPPQLGRFSQRQPHHAGPPRQLPQRNRRPVPGHIRPRPILRKQQHQLRQSVQKKPTVSLEQKPASFNIQQPSSKLDKQFEPKRDQNAKPDPVDEKPTRDEPVTDTYRADETKNNVFLRQNEVNPFIANSHGKELKSAEPTSYSTTTSSSDTTRAQGVENSQQNEESGLYYYKPIEQDQKNVEVNPVPTTPEDDPFFNQDVSELGREAGEMFDRQDNFDLYEDQEFFQQGKEFNHEEEYFLDEEYGDGAGTDYEDYNPENDQGEQVEICEPLGEENPHGKSLSPESRVDEQPEAREPGRVYYKPIEHLNAYDKAVNDYLTKEEPQAYKSSYKPLPLQVQEEGPVYQPKETTQYTIVTTTPPPATPQYRPIQYTSAQYQQQTSPESTTRTPGEVYFKPYYAPEAVTTGTTPQADYYYNSEEDEDEQLHDESPTYETPNPSPVYETESSANPFAPNYDIFDSYSVFEGENRENNDGGDEVLEFGFTDGEFKIPDFFRNFLSAPPSWIKVGDPWR